MAKKEEPAKPEGLTLAQANAVIANNVAALKPVLKRGGKAYFSEEQYGLLNEPMKASVVSEREGGNGRKLSYIEGYHAIDEANRIFGFDNWDMATLGMEKVYEVEVEIGQRKTPGIEVGYMARVIVKAGGCDRVQHGFGNGRSSNFKDAHELAIKEAETDALKRALRTFGNQFGNALYDKEQKNVVDDEEIAAEAERAKRKAEKKAKATTTAEKTEAEAEAKPSTDKDKFLKSINACKTEEALANFKTENLKAVLALPKEDKDEVVKAFNTRKNKLIKGE